MKKLFTSLFSLLFISVQAALAQDLTITGATSPASGCGIGPMSPVSVTVVNNGPLAAEGGFWIEYFYTYNTGVGGPQGPFVGFQDYNSDDVFVGSPLIHTFSDLINVSLPAVYTITATVTFAGDAITANNTFTFNVTNFGAPITVTPSTPYLETFEAAGHNWSSSGTNSSWALGTPAKTNINTSYGGGTKSWVTKLTGNYNDNEVSFVESPCFNLSQMVDPVIEMAVWWHSQTNTDGAVLQASTDGGVTWQRVGSFGDSINWYNSNNVTAFSAPALNIPTGQRHGWAGTGASSSGGWVIARHDLRTSAGVSLNQNGVKLRIVFASNATTNSDGFAFDNVVIRDKPALDIVLLNYQPFNISCGLGAAENVRINFFNNGTTTLQPNSFTLYYSIAGAPLVAEPYNGPPVAPFTAGSYTFNATYDFTTGPVFPIYMELSLAGDANPATNSKSSVIYNSLVPENYAIGFEGGPRMLDHFSITTRPQSRVMVHPIAAYSGNFGMVMDGGTDPLNWSEFDALTNPWGPNSNPNRFSQALLCVKTPDSLATLKVSFYLKQLFYQSFLHTNFRLTANGQPVPLLVNNVPFVPSGNNQALRPPITFDPAVTNTWMLIEADLTSFIDTAATSIQIGFESNVRYPYNQTATAGTANLLDSIMITSTYVIPVNCQVTPYDPACPCGPVLFVEANCCPDPNNLLCPISAPDMLKPTLIQVFPNPSSGEISIDLQGLTPNMYTIEIMDVTGKTARREMLMLQGQPSHTLDLSKEAKGIYFVKVSSDTKVYTGKVALQ